MVLDIFDFFLLYLKMQAIFSLKMPSVKGYVKLLVEVLLLGHRLVRDLLRDCRISSDSDDRYAVKHQRQIHKLLCVNEFETSTTQLPGISTFEDWLVEIPASCNVVINAI